MRELLPMTEQFHDKNYITNRTNCSYFHLLLFCILKFSQKRLLTAYNSKTTGSAHYLYKTSKKASSSFNGFNQTEMCYLWFKTLTKETVEQGTSCVVLHDHAHTALLQILAPRLTCLSETPRIREPRSPLHHCPILEGNKDSAAKAVVRTNALCLVGSGSLLSN